MRTIHRITTIALLSMGVALFPVGCGDSPTDQDEHADHDHGEHAEQDDGAEQDEHADHDHGASSAEEAPARGENE